MNILGFRNFDEQFDSAVKLKEVCDQFDEICVFNEELWDKTVFSKTTDRNWNKLMFLVLRSIYPLRVYGLEDAKHQILIANITHDRGIVLKDRFI